MKLSELSPAKNSLKNRRRVGRGNGSGWGRTAARGEKGQNARSGGGVRPGFEGGQMPLARRVPKRGFTNIYAKSYDIINLDQLNGFDEGTAIDKQLLADKGMIRSIRNLVKVLARGELTVKKLHVAVDAWSKEAQTKIETNGGQLEKA